ncbi:MAG: hypothetical protein JW754_01215 [Candidatus Aenigmarchaeota archaeon]|nr:hypothetical protein [Candidatus Aenigmarchaeota archaeon]
MKGCIIKRIGPGWIFLLIVIFLYGAASLVNYVVFIESLAAFWNLVLSVVPVVILVFALVFLANLWVTPGRIMKYLGKGSGRKGWVISIAGGILSTGPIYMWYPLLKDLKSRGMKNSLISVFLYNRSLKIPLLPMMIFYFGWAFTIILSAYMIIFSVFNGIIVEKIVGDK